MFKIFSRLADMFRSDADGSDTPVWARDPLSHPDISAMDGRALGDLPFGLFRPRDMAEDCGRRPA
ncbi:hypothetical protein Q9314_05990 [Shinella sumterensis]|nr:hypothetical protein [Shinella zoogloeoides]WLS09323.1 hypothetical protein Q9314_05990 [Shinella sumterensis]